MSSKKTTIITDFCMEHMMLKCIYPNGDNFKFIVTNKGSRLECCLSLDEDINDYQTQVLADWIRCSHDNDADLLFERLEEICIQASSGDELISLMSLFIINAN